MYRVSPSFESRLNRIEFCNRRLSKGVEHYVLDDGLIVAMPRRRPSTALAFLIVLLLPLVTALGAKSFLLARFDAVAFEELLSRFEAMGETGKALLWLMQPEPLTAALSQVLTGLFG
ncbi:hypothetical protein [Limimaricola soesokkakensis]|uniref:hypothetical protein n=1 Tax=Limimaricola soesokkakensis TaxID=1343159 RepID=UPI0035189D51